MKFGDKIYQQSTHIYDIIHLTVFDVVHDKNDHTVHTFFSK